MLTRGYLIGQIVDDLTAIASQAKQRARLHLFDIHIHIEDFAKELLNKVLELELTNLNQQRSNNPGLDLGDQKNGWAFQVTADKSSAKVRETIEKIDAEQREKYPNIRILVIGEKQGSYTFSSEPFLSFGFTPEMVWDFNDVCSRLMPMSVDALVDLSQYISSETRRVRLELEIPDEDGRFPTSIADFVEAIPKPRVSDGSKMKAYFEAINEPMEIDVDVIKEAIVDLSETLQSLPRLTREVFKIIIERHDKKKVGSQEDFRISDPKLRRIYRGGDLDGDLALLVEAELLSFEEPDNPGESYYWRIYLPKSADSFHLYFMEYVEYLLLDLQKPLVILDFSDF